MFQKLLDRTVGFVTGHNRITLLVMLLLTAGVLAGIPQIDTASQASADPAAFEDLDRIETANYIEAAYGNTSEQNENRTIQPVYVRQEEGNVLSKTSLLDGLAYQQEISANDSVQATLHEGGIVGIENLVATRLAGDRTATLDEQQRALENASAAEVQQVVEQVVTEDPRAQQFLTADHDGATTATDRRMLVAIDTGTAEETLTGASTALHETAKEYDDAGVFVLNGPAWEESRSHFFGQMIELVLPVALLVILLILVFGYRDLVDVVVGMSGVLLSVLWMFGLLGWLGVGAGILSIIPVVLITGLSIDFGFHVFNRYREERGSEEGIRAPMGRGVRLVATALILVTVTASIGFLANLANPLPMIRNLGVSITLGVISALVIFVTVVPALKISIDGLLERVGIDRRKAALGHGSYLRPILDSTVTLARRAAPVVLVVAVLVGAMGGFAWTELDRESFQQSDGEVADWKQNLPGPLGWETSDVMRQQAHVDEAYQPASADDAVQSRILVEDDVTSDDTLTDIEAGIQSIDDAGLLLDRSNGQVVQSPVTAMRRVAQQDESFATAFQQADTDGDGVPDRNLESLYDAFYEADSETAARVIERTDGEYESVLVTVALTADYADASSAVSDLDEATAVMEGDGQRTATAAGTLAINDAVLGEIVQGILLTMVIALLTIILTLAVVFRAMHGSLTLGAVVALPIALVVALAIGGMYLLSIPLTLLTALLMSLTIGLGVDYNIHIGDRFADELAAGKQPTEALSAAVTGTGGALLGSTLTSAGAFATIALVPHPQLESFGGIVVIALVTSFLVSLLVLPSLLLLWSRYTSVRLSVPESNETAMPQD